MATMYYLTSEFKILDCDDITKANPENPNPIDLLKSASLNLPEHPEMAKMQIDMALDLIQEAPDEQR